MIAINRQAGEKPYSSLSCLYAVGVYWKHKKFLSDPRVCIIFEDGGVLTSGHLPMGLGPEAVAQELRYLIHAQSFSEVHRLFPEYLIFSRTVSCVDWKYGKNFYDKRLVVYFDNGSSYVSGPFPITAYVSAFVQFLTDLNKKSNACYRFEIHNGEPRCFAGWYAIKEEMDAKYI
jgi:hypothetical protein